MKEKTKKVKCKIPKKQKVVEVSSSDDSSTEEPSSPIMKRKKRRKPKPASHTTPTVVKTAQNVAANASALPSALTASNGKTVAVDLHQLLELVK